MTEQELAEVSDLVNIDPKKFQKMIEKDTLGSLQMRLHSITTYKNKLPQQGLETPEERIRKKARLDQLITALQSEIQKKETERSKGHFEAEKQWVEKAVVEQLPNLRQCSEDGTSRMQNVGTMGVPLDVLQWNRLTSTIIEVKCHSGKVRKLDLKKLHPQVLHNLLETPFRPMFFIMEPEGMVSREGEPVKIWSNQSDYATVMSQRQVQRTVLALMWVG
jgi:hypothetical protein